VPPKWSKWRSFRQIASSLGKMLEIDWNSLFSSFFRMVRIKIDCKDTSKIPKRMLFEMDNKFYLIQFKVEGSAEAEEDGTVDRGDDNGDPSKEEDTWMEELQHDSMLDNQKHYEGRAYERIW
jgi:hypothetical protein